MGSVSRLLPRFFRYLEQLKDEEKIAQAIREAGEAPPDSNGRVLRRSANGHDPARLRGLPAIGRNVTGASPGTDPVNALLRKEGGRRR
jgi:hypothetical protein